MPNFLANLLQAAAKALGAIETIESVGEQDLAAIAQGETQYEAGAPVVLGTISVESHPGKIIAVLDGGSASKTLGLS